MSDRSKNMVFRILLILLACVCIGYFCFTFFFQSHTLTANDFGNPKVLNKWYVQIDGAPYGSVSIPGSFYSGRQVSLLITLPKIDESDYISIYTANTRIMVYADKKLIYEFGYSGETTTSIPPILYEHLVPVSPEYTSKRLRIDMYPVYFPANRITRPILLGSALQIQLYNYSVMRSDTIGYVLAAIGGVILFFGIYYFSKNRKDRSLLVLGGLYMMLAGKLCAQSCLTASLFSDPYTSFYIFWISLLGTPLFVTLLLYRSYGSGMQRFFHIIIYAQILFMLTALILILLDIEFYAVLLTVFYILVTGFMVALFVRIRILSKVKKLSGATTTYLIMLFGLFLVDISNHYFQYIPVEFLSYNTLWLTSTAFYFTYHIIASKVRAAYARENEYQAMLLKSESLLHSYTQIDEYNTKIEKMRHDMWKHLSVLDALLEDGCVRSALEYLEKLLKNADARSLAIASPNHIINAIIQHNIERAKRANVNFTFDVRLPEYFNVEDVDLCSVFANCLDNALDACEIFNGKRFVHLASYIKNGHLYLRLENSARKCDQSKHRSHHGWGLKIVRDVVEKYDGIMQISPADNGVFIIEIALRLPMEAGSNCQEEAASAALPQ